MLVHAVHHYITSSIKVHAFNSELFYKAVLSFLRRLREIYDMLERGDVDTFAIFMDTSLRVTPLHFRNSLALIQERHASGGSREWR